jgi:hypothetical protein
MDSPTPQSQPARPTRRLPLKTKVALSLSLLILAIITFALYFNFTSPPPPPTIKIIRITRLSSPLQAGTQYPHTLTGFLQKYGQEIPVPGADSPDYKNLKASLVYHSLPSNEIIPYDPTFTWVLAIQENGKPLNIWIDCVQMGANRGVTYVQEQETLKYPIHNTQELCQCLDRLQKQNTNSPAVN